MDVLVSACKECEIDASHTSFIHEVAQFEPKAVSRFHKLRIGGGEGGGEGLMPQERIQRSTKFHPQNMRTTSAHITNFVDITFMQYT